MNTGRKVFVAAAAALVILTLAGCGGSSSKDKSSSGGSGVTVAGGSGTPVAVDNGENADGTYFMKVDTTTVAAGKVTFTMHNSGTKQHEMVVLKTDTPADQLKVGSDGKVSEADSVGEVSETDAGKSGTVTLNLKAGSYVLVCNIEHHYEKHMYSAFTVS